MNKNSIIGILGIFLLNLLSSCQSDESIKLAYKFKQDKEIQSDKRSYWNFRINKIVIPQKNFHLSDSGSLRFQNDSIFGSIREILSKDDLKSLRIDLETILTETITGSMIDSAYISRVSELTHASLEADNRQIRTGESLFSFMKVVLSEKQNRKRLSSGEWYDLPRIMGMDLSGAQADPYIGRLLMYMKNGFALPDAEITPGYKWDSNLSVSIPVDSLSKGQSQGFIDIDIVNKQELVKAGRKIADIALDFQLIVKWDVTVPDEGFSRCEFSLTGSGHRFFNIRKGWDYGMFLKGDSRILIDSETRDKVDPGKLNTLIINATGNFELGSKTR